MATGSGLVRRTAIASVLLVMIVAGAFAVLLREIDDLRETTALSRHSQRVLVAANALERSVIDLETGVRGFLITDDRQFLEPWRAAQAGLAVQTRELTSLTVVAAQRRRSTQAVEAVEAYARDYSLPLVVTAQRRGPSTISAATLVEGKRRVDAIREQFRALIAAEQGLAAGRQERSDAAARRAVVGATAGLLGSIVLIVLFAGYIVRAVVAPVRRAAGMAGRLAGGDLSVRMPETGRAEMGALERSFNSMGRSLEQSRDELRLVADEQAALRRVATLVARRVPPSELFGAVGAEVGALLGADATWLVRYESDRTFTVVCADGDHVSERSPLGTKVPFVEGSVLATVAQTRRAARRDDPEAVSGPAGAVAADLGIRSIVGAPIVVEDRLWGVMTLAWRLAESAPRGIENRLNEFTELVATAIANADSRAQLAASRARVVAAGDDSRRRIERDLHDGTQQRLVSLGLELRAAEATVPAELPELKRQIAHTAAGLAGALEDLQEIARGIHPAILSRGGLGPALRTLARRSPVPVELSSAPDRRLPEGVEAALYYVAAEALTNAAKHAEASVVRVSADYDDHAGVIRLSICDDGVGGVDSSRGTGLVGLRDRVEALGGTVVVASPRGEGTSIVVRIPVDADPRLPRGA